MSHEKGSAEPDKKSASISKCLGPSCERWLGDLGHVPSLLCVPCSKGEIVIANGSCKSSVPVSSEPKPLLFYLFSAGWGAANLLSGVSSVKRKIAYLIQRKAADASVGVSLKTFKKNSIITTKILKTNR